MFRKKTIKWTNNWVGSKEIDCSDPKLLHRLITERGKILPRKITGLSSRQQRKVAKAIKRARQLGSLPYIVYGTE